MTHGSGKCFSSLVYNIISRLEMTSLTGFPGWRWRKAKYFETFRDVLVKLMSVINEEVEF
jgi:hypothetical protein